MEIEKYFKAYESLAESIEKAFKQISDSFPKEVRCRPGCSDCCYALFDITLVEAIYINKKFREKYSDEEREKILKEAEKADREIHVLKRKAFKEQKKGTPEVEIIGQMAMAKVKCPLLNESRQCRLYEFRPLNCRVYGVPTQTGNSSHICGRTGFEQGKQYPTIKMDNLYEYLYKISNDFVDSLNTSFVEMGSLLMPLSMALMTDFNEDFLGIKDKET